MWGDICSAESLAARGKWQFWEVISCHVVFLKCMDFSETLFKGSIAEQMQLSAVTQRPWESTLHFPLFSFPWSGKLWEFPPRAKELSLDVGDKNCLFSLEIIFCIIMFHSTCLFYHFVTHYSLINQSAYYYYHLLDNNILNFIWIFVLMVYLLSKIYSQSRLVKSNCPNLC